MSKSAQAEALALLAGTAQYVLETTAFAFAEEAIHDDEFAFGGGFVATIEMSNDLEGVLTLAAPAELCHTLSADILGLEPDEINAQSAADTLAELANIVAGRLATDLLGEDAIVNLRPPRLNALDSSDWHALLIRPTSVVLSIDDGPLLLDFKLLATACNESSAT